MEHYLKTRPLLNESDVQRLGERKHTVAVSIHPRNGALEQASPSFYMQKHSRHPVFAEAGVGSCVTGSLYALVWHYHLGSISILVECS